MNSKFNAERLADAVVSLHSAEASKATINQELKAAKAAKMNWLEMRDPITSGLEKRGLKDGALRVTLSTIKWCYTEGVQLDTLTKSRMIAKADKGLAVDLMTGKPKTVKAKTAKKADKGNKAKTEAVVKHCGYGLAEAMTQPGFIKFLDTLIYNLSFDGYEALSLEDLKLDLIRKSLEDCGFMVKDGAEWKVAVIKESEDEVKED